MCLKAVLQLSFCHIDDLPRLLFDRVAIEVAGRNRRGSANWRKRRSVIREKNFSAFLPA